MTEPLSIGSRRTRPGSEPNEHLFFFKKVSPRCGPQNDQCVRCHFQRAHFHCTQQQASRSLQETTATNHRPIGNDNHHHSRSALFLVSQSANCVPNVALVFQHWCHISSAPHFAIPKFCTFLVPPPPPRYSRLPCSGVPKKAGCFHRTFASWSHPTEGCLNDDVAVKCVALKGQMKGAMGKCSHRRQCPWTANPNRSDYSMHHLTWCASTSPRLYLQYFRHFRHE